MAIKSIQFGTGLKVAANYFGLFEITQMKRNEKYVPVKEGGYDGSLRTSTCAEFMKPWVENYSGSEADS